MEVVSSEDDFDHILATLGESKHSQLAALAQLSVVSQDLAQQPGSNKTGAVAEDSPVGLDPDGKENDQEDEQSAAPTEHDFLTDRDPEQVPTASSSQMMPVASSQEIPDMWRQVRPPDSSQEVSFLRTNRPTQFGRCLCCCHALQPRVIKQGPYAGRAALGCGHYPHCVAPLLRNLTPEVLALFLARMRGHIEQPRRG